MPSKTLALAAYQLMDAGFHQTNHEVSGSLGNEYYDFTGLGAVMRLVRDQGEEFLEIEDPDGSGWYKPSRWLRTENSQMSLADCVAMIITRRSELRSAITRDTATSDQQEPPFGITGERGIRASGVDPGLQVEGDRHGVNATPSTRRRAAGITSRVRVSESRH